MKKLTEKGFSALELILILVVVSLIGFGGWYVWKHQNKSAKVTNTTTTTAKVTETPATTEYKNSQLAVSFSYPSDWGTATLSDGPLSKYQTGQYKQLTFSKVTNLSINFVTGVYSSPLDACGYDDPVQNAQHAQNGKQASVIGWEGDNIKRFIKAQGAAAGSVYLVNSKPGDTGSGWTQVSSDAKVLVYQDINTKIVAGNGDGCSAITQAQADQANAFSKFYHYAVNYSNAPIKGVNAQYDARQIDVTSVKAQLTQALNTLK